MGTYFGAYGPDAPPAALAARPRAQQFPATPLPGGHSPLQPPMQPASPNARQQPTHTAAMVSSAKAHLLCRGLRASEGPRATLHLHVLMKPMDSTP